MNEHRAEQNGSHVNNNNACGSMMGEREFVKLALQVTSDMISDSKLIACNSDIDGSFRVKISRSDFAGSSTDSAVTWYLSTVYEKMKEQYLLSTSSMIGDELVDINDESHHDLVKNRERLVETMKEEMKDFFDLARISLSDYTTTVSEMKDIYPILRITDTATENDYFTVPFDEMPGLEWVFCSKIEEPSSFLSVHDAVSLAATIEGDYAGMNSTALRVISLASDNAHSFLAEWGRHLWQRPFSGYDIYVLRLPFLRRRCTSILAAPELIEDLNLPGNAVLFLRSYDEIFVTGSQDVFALDYCIGQCHGLQSCVAPLNDIAGDESLEQKSFWKDNIYDGPIVMLKDDSMTYYFLPFDVTDAEAVPLGRNISHSSNISSGEVRPRRLEFTYLNTFGDEPVDSLVTANCWNCAVSFLNGRVKPLRCANCKVASYCQKVCQRKDWKIHKMLCERIVKRKHKEKAD